MKKFSHNKHGSAGFTLVELTVVIVLLALLGTIAVSVALLVTRAERNYRLDARTQSELLEAETCFKDWLMQCDEAGATLTVSAESLTVQVAGTVAGSFSYTAGTAVAEVGGEESTAEFSAVTAMKFSRSGQVICCEIAVRDFGSCKVLYTMRAAQVKEVAAAG